MLLSFRRYNIRRPSHTPMQSPGLPLAKQGYKRSVNTVFVYSTRAYLKFTADSVEGAGLPAVRAVQPCMAVKLEKTTEHKHPHKESCLFSSTKKHCMIEPQLRIDLSGRAQLEISLTDSLLIGQILSHTPWISTCVSGDRVCLVTGSVIVSV